MTIKKFTTAALLLCSLLLLTAVTWAATQRPYIAELASNAEYMSLYERSTTLNRQSDSINRLLEKCREQMHSNVRGVDLEALSEEIIHLEQQAHMISDEQGGVLKRISAIEQEFYVQYFLSSQSQVVIGDVIDDTVVDTQDSNFVANLYCNDCFKNELSAEDYADLLKGQEEEGILIGCAHEYVRKYDKLVKTVQDYERADRASIADPLYEQYELYSAELQALDESMTTMWNHIIDIKYYALDLVLERRHRYDVKERAERNYNNMESSCAQMDGLYSSNALMRYALGRHTLLAYEMEFARDMRIKPAYDSLKYVYERYVKPEFSRKPIFIERREFKDFEKVKIGRTNFYNETNPLPELKVYESGTIYRILLGTFRSKQAMTLFKGIQPMSIARDGDGRYCYFAGGYATEADALEDLQFLKDKGFKAPELCRWVDGVMTNITALNNAAKAQSETAKPAAESKVRYVVIIRTESLDSNMRSIINATTPGKSVSRRGSNCVVGLFKDRGEADMIVSALSDAYPMLEMAVSETKVE